MAETSNDALPSASHHNSSPSASPDEINHSTIENTLQIPDGAASPLEYNSWDSLESSDSDDEEPTEPPLPEEPIQGWPQLASLMAKTPEFAAFSRFRDLNIKSLLYYQAQLAIYREKLHELEYRDAALNYVWHERADKLVQSESKQFEIVQEMRRLLKEYNKALLLFSKVCALPEAEDWNMRTLRTWLRNERGANFKVRGALGLPHTWGSIMDSQREDINLWKQFGRMISSPFREKIIPSSDLDLVLTSPKKKIDGFTRWFAGSLIMFVKGFQKYRQEKRDKRAEQSLDEEMTASTTGDFLGKVRDKAKRRKGKKRKKNRIHNTGTSRPYTTSERWEDAIRQASPKEETLESWGEMTALKITSGLSTVIASLLPVIAISVLSQLQGLRSLLLCLAGFAVVFAVGLVFLARGTSSMTEIFAATAAFSAVMVVFISVPPAPVIVVPPGSPTPSISPSPTVLR